LGLAICRQLAHLLGGDIEVESAGIPGQGSRFRCTVTMRACRRQDEAPDDQARVVVVGEESPAAASREPLSTLRVLIAEDNPGNLILMRKLLQSMGVSADFAHNGLEAVEAARQVAYDVILMDVQMPELDGIEATRRIRRFQPDRQPILQIIALTANATEEDRLACFEAGMNGFITKPVRMQRLTEVLEHCALVRWSGAS